jgi:hypothetical protein
MPSVLAYIPPVRARSGRPISTRKIYALRDMDHVQELVMPVLARGINVVAFSNAARCETRLHLYQLVG